MRMLVKVLLVASLAPFSLPAGVILVTSQGYLADPNETSVVHSLGGDRIYSTISLYRPGYTGGGTQKDGYENAWDTLPGAAWVSFANTVCTYCTHTDLSPSVLPADPTRVFYDPVPGEYVTFYDKFTISDGTFATGGFLDILADDSVTVFLNDVQIASFMQPILLPGDTRHYNYLLDSNGDGLHVDYAHLAPYLVSGENVLSIRVTNLGPGDLGYQGDGHGFWSFGLTYSMTIDTMNAPEPATLLVSALGMAGLIVYRRRRSAKSSN
jgi:hypothetical protein